MEKNQQNTTPKTENENNRELGHQPGQQLPSGSNKEQLDHPTMSEENVRHSDTSFPQSDQETLGTP